MVANFILYMVVTLAIVVFSVLAVTSRRILRSATYLLFVLIATAVVYFQLGYEFLGAVQIAVYAGGILVLFVFAILLTHSPGQLADRVPFGRQLFGLITAALGVALLWYLFVSFPLVNGMPLSQMLEGDNLSMNEIGKALMSTDKFGYLLPFEAISVLLLACIIGGLTIARKN